MACIPQSRCIIEPAAASGLLRSVGLHVGGDNAW